MPAESRTRKVRKYLLQWVTNTLQNPFSKTLNIHKPLTTESPPSRQVGLPLQFPKIAKVDKVSPITAELENRLVLLFKSGNK
jgi:hypothetical protein